LIKINDKISLAYYERGKIKFRLKDYASAVKDFKASVDLMPNGVYHYWTALASYRMRYYEGALNQVQESIKLMPEFAVAHLLQGDISFSMRDYRRSRASYMKTKELDPDNAEIYDKRLRTVNRRIRKARR
ncbi:MAG: tetratricopeptide repeat protein, partial [Elusimicrobiota bacterium]|nr:tetratricopeptide repeat protein [Elusimicrobiota bacterium]